MPENTHHRTPAGESQPAPSNVRRDAREPESQPTAGSKDRETPANPTVGRTIDETGNADVRHGDLDELDDSKRGIN